MSRTKTIIISVLLMGSAIIIQLLSKAQPEILFIDFFSGIVFGAGIVIFLQTIFKKKKEL